MNNNVFYGNKLRLARTLKGFSQKELGDLVATSRQFIHQLEAGLRQPAIDVLNAFCEILQVEPSFFSRPLINDVKPEQCHFRKRRATTAALIDRVLAFSTLFEELISYLHEFLDLPLPNVPAIYNVEEPYTAQLIEEAAENCRKQWKLGLLAPISNLIRILENFGIIVTQFSGVSEKVDALSINRKFPIIIRNTAKESICRLRFDLAHELGHFVLHDGLETGDHITEAEANRFASAFLLPRTAFLKEFPNLLGKNIPWNFIYDFKIRWGVSVKAIMYRAHSLGLLNAQQYRNANVFLSKSGQTRVEKFDEKIKPEEPELFPKAIEMMSKIGVSPAKIAQRMGISSSLFSELTGVAIQENVPDNIIPFFSKRLLNSV
ncbi:ImmA/IrrE family metallo-endopeptidase [bacterium]|nr:ImmA/IrrE family metallo-endopeptidase [bacterium]